MQTYYRLWSQGNYNLQENGMLEFVCPECGGTELLEIRTGCTVVSDVRYVDAEGEIDYAPEPEVGRTEQDRMYQCTKCRWVLQGINSVRELVAWLKGEI